MTKTALIESLASELGVSKRMAGELVNAFIGAVMKGVKKEGEVRIQGFGTFKKSKRAARTGRNPQKDGNGAGKRRRVPGRRLLLSASSRCRMRMP